MGHSETWALIPVKKFSRAKSRLAEILFGPEREKFARAMLQDVLQNLAATTSIDGIAVVSSDPEALSIARTFGAAPIVDPEEAGINKALQYGLDAFQSYARRVVIVPADIPFAMPRDFANVVELLNHTPIVLVPALHDGGTNALAMRAPDLLRPQFGEESFGKHRRAARERDLGCSVLRSDGIGRDIDGPLDFDHYLLDLLGSRDFGLTGSFLEQIKIAERFGVKDAPVPVRLL
jgi:2-phospho-L-lactate guanylyltransferase